MEYAIIGLACLFFAGHGLQWFFLKTKIPDLLILTIVGYICGPVLGLIRQEDLGQIGGLVSTLALIVILYEAGLHLSTKELKEAWVPSLLMSLLSFTTISICVLFIVAPIVGFPQSILVSFAVGSTSSAIVIPMVKFLSLGTKTKTILSLESAFTDIFAIVFFLVALEAILEGYLDFNSVAFNIGPKTLISMGVGLFAGFLWAWIKRLTPEYTYMKFAGESWALLCYGLSSLAGLNGAMSVLCLGFTLANLNLLPRWLTRYCSIEPISFEEMSLLKEVTFLLKTFFFLYLGTLISFSNFTLVLVGALITLAIFVTRFCCVWLIMPKSKFSLIEVLSTVSMGPRGLACAVLATIPLSKGLSQGSNIQQILFAVIPLSIFITASLIFLCENAKTRKYLQIFFPSHEDSSLNRLQETTENE